MSIKRHYPHCHFDSFPDILGDPGDEQGERFQQDTKTIEQEYQGVVDFHMIADCCWRLNRQFPSALRAKNVIAKEALNIKQIRFYYIYIFVYIYNSISFTPIYLCYIPINCWLESNCSMS